jgi:hypothetical protein
MPPKKTTKPPMETTEGAGMKMTWRQYFTKHTKGKKISNMGEHMKKLSVEYKKMKK